MSLMDISLVALLAVPRAFFMGVAWLYCTHAHSVVKELRRLNKTLEAKCHHLEEDNCKLHAIADTITAKDVHKASAM